VNDERTEVAVQVVAAASVLLREAGAFTDERLRDRLDSTGWRNDEIDTVLGVLAERGWIVGGFLPDTERRVWVRGRREL
jgi:hypothetical protein